METTKTSLFRNKYIRIFAALLAIGWMCMIFSYSSDTAEESTAISRPISYDLVDGFQGFFGLQWDESHIEAVGESIEKAVRKTAHMTEYAVLFILCGIAADAWTQENSALPRKVITLGITGLYAASDEFHQTFVEGRTGKVSDVLIDLTGAVIAMIVITLIVCSRRKGKECR